MLCMTKQPRERNEKETQIQNPLRKEGSQKAERKGAGAELESLAGCRECLVGWIELRELRGTGRALKDTAELSVPSACFWSVLGMPPLENLPAGGGYRAAQALLLLQGDRRT